MLIQKMSHDLETVQTFGLGKRKFCVWQISEGGQHARGLDKDCSFCDYISIGISTEEL